MESITLEQAAELLGESVHTIRRRITEGRVDPLHSVDEVAEAFGVSPATVRDLCGRHRWPHVRLGRSIRFTDAQVREIVQLHTNEVSKEERQVLNLMMKGLTRRSAEYHVRPRSRPRRRS